jgi:hypothetical protein
MLLGMSAAMPALIPGGRSSRPDPNVAHLWAMPICWSNDWLKSHLYL